MAEIEDSPTHGELLEADELVQATIVNRREVRRRAEDRRREKGQALEQARLAAEQAALAKSVLLTATSAADAADRAEKALEMKLDKAREVRAALEASRQLEALRLNKPEESAAGQQQEEDSPVAIKSSTTVADGVLAFGVAEDDEEDEDPLPEEVLLGQGAAGQGGCPFLVFEVVCGKVPSRNTPHFRREHALTHYKAELDALLPPGPLNSLSQCAICGERLKSRPRRHLAVSCLGLDRAIPAEHLEMRRWVGIEEAQED